MVPGLECASHHADAAHDAPPLLFVHGAYCGAWVWEEHFLPWFAQRGWHASAVSLEGHGDSRGHAWLAALGIDDFVRNIRAVVEKMPRPPVLIGHSMGGFVLQRYLEMYPHDLPAGVVLMASVPPSGVNGSAWRMMTTAPDLLAALNLFQASERYHPDLGQAQRLLFSPDIDHGRLMGWVNRFQAESMRALFDMSMIGFFPASKLPYVPALVLGAANDQLISPQEVVETACRLGVVAEVLPDIAHLMMLDTRWEMAAEQVEGWLQREFVAAVAVSE